MSLKHWKLLGCLAVVGLLACSMASPALAEQGVEIGSKEVTMEQVPKAVKETILKEAGKNKIEELEEKTLEGNKIVYEAMWMVEGKEIELQVSPDGKVVNKKTEDAAEAKAAAPVTVEKSPAKLPDAAAAALKKAYGKATIKGVEVEPTDGVDLLKVVLLEKGKEREVEVSPDGILVSTQIDVSESDLPRKVRKSVKEAIEGGKIIKMEKEVIWATISEGKVTKLAKPTEIYEVKFTQGEAWNEVKIAADGAAMARKIKGWRSEFNVDKKKLVSTGRNPYFMLVPGHKIHLKGGGETVIISVLDETKVVDGVETRVVEEREFKGDKLAEVSRNYFAMDKTTNDVYYFGEDVDVYQNDKVVGHGGAWLSGVKGAKFGLIMPGKPKVGDKYYQEYAPKAAMDRAENVDLKATLKTPMKTFKDVLYVRETSSLESGTSQKWYVAGIGMIGDDDLRVVKVETSKEAE